MAPKEKLGLLHVLLRLSPYASNSNLWKTVFYLIVVFCQFFYLCDVDDVHDRDDNQDSSKMELVLKTSSVNQSIDERGAREINFQRIIRRRNCSTRLTRIKCSTIS
jgi:hypothetical protein